MAMTPLVQRPLMMRQPASVAWNGNAQRTTLACVTNPAATFSEVIEAIYIMATTAEDQDRTPPFCEVPELHKQHEENQHQPEISRRKLDTSVQEQPRRWERP